MHGPTEALYKIHRPPPCDGGVVQMLRAPRTGLTTRTILNSRRGRLAVLLALIAVTALIAVSAISLVTLAKKKGRKASAKAVASAKLNDRNSAKRERRERREKGRRGETAERGERQGAQPEGDRYEALLEQEAYWAARLTYPTGNFDPAWVREAIK